MYSASTATLYSERIYTSMRFIQLCIILFRLVKQRPKLSDVINYVVPKWATQWRRLGMRLGIDNHLMDIIQHDHPNDCESCSIQMLIEWININTTASWEEILCALEKLSSYGEYQLIAVQYSYRFICFIDRGKPDRAPLIYPNFSLHIHAHTLMLTCMHVRT